VIGVGLRSHYVASVYAAPLLMRTAEREAQGYTPCIVNVGSFGGVVRSHMHTYTDAYMYMYVIYRYIN
jgi:hypothetical protein